MSSHHFVREDQEPALLIDHPDVAFEDLAHLLEWSPTVLVTQPALSRVLSWGIKIDIVVVNEADRETLRPQLLEQQPLKILSASDDGLRTALQFIQASKQQFVSVFTTTSLGVLQAMNVTLDMVVFNNAWRWVFMRSGNFEKWLPAGTQLSIHPPDAEVTCTGLDETLCATIDGIVTIQQPQHRAIWVGEWMQ